MKHIFTSKMCLATPSIQTLFGKTCQLETEIWLSLKFSGWKLWCWLWSFHNVSLGKYKRTGHFGHKIVTNTHKFSCYNFVQIVANQVGPKRAKEMWFLAKFYTAAEAERMGLVNTVVPVSLVSSNFTKFGCIPFHPRQSYMININLWIISSMRFSSWRSWSKKQSNGAVRLWETAQLQFVFANLLSMHPMTGIPDFR